MHKTSAHKNQALDHHHQLTAAITADQIKIATTVAQQCPSLN
jgi:hypothetical protein